MRSLSRPNFVSQEVGVVETSFREMHNEKHAPHLINWFGSFSALAFAFLHTSTRTWTPPRLPKNEFFSLGLAGPSSEATLSNKRTDNLSRGDARGAAVLLEEVSADSSLAAAMK